MGNYFIVKATAACVVYRDSSRKELLLTKRTISPFKDHWCIPGGHIDKFEHAVDAANREVKEETGLDFKGQFAFYSEEIIPELDWHAVALVFTGVGEGVLEKEDAEVSEIGWFSIEDALKLELAFCHRDILVRIAEK